MKFDDIFKEIGEFGPYQRRNYLLLVVGWVLTGPIMVLSVFVMGSPDHRLESYPRHIYCYYDTYIAITETNCSPLGTFYKSFGV